MVHDLPEVRVEPVQQRRPLLFDHTAAPRPARTAPSTPAAPRSRTDISAPSCSPNEWNSGRYIRITSLGRTASRFAWSPTSRRDVVVVHHPLGETPSSPTCTAGTTSPPGRPPTPAPPAPRLKPPPPPPPTSSTTAASPHTPDRSARSPAAARRKPLHRQRPRLRPLPLPFPNKLVHHVDVPNRPRLIRRDQRRRVRVP